MKTTKKQAPKKGNPLMISQQYHLDFEHQFKSTELKIDELKHQLEGNTRLLNDFENLIENKKLIHLNEANKSFSQIKNSILKMNKDLENLQKQRCKFETEFEQNFETPFLENQFSSQESTVLEGTRQNITRIKEGLYQQQGILTAIVDPSQGASKRLMMLEEKLNKLFLPDQIKEATKQSEALNERLKSIYDTLAHSKLDSPGRAESHLKQVFLPLSTAYQQEGEWLQRIASLSTPAANPVVTASAPIVVQPEVIEKVTGLRLN